LAHITETNLESYFNAHPSKQEVVKYFGKPSIEDTNSEGHEEAVYAWDFPRGPASTGWSNRLSGFEVSYSNDTAFTWSPSYSSLRVDKSDTSIKIQKPSGAEPDKRHQLLFYIVSSSPLADGKHINTDKFKDPGYISSKPDFAISKLKAVEYHLVQSSVDNTIQNQYVVAVSLETNDTQRLEKFTGDNSGSVLLIALDDSPLETPYIKSPISSGRFEITQLGQTESSNLVNNLENMVVK
jgi:hypothetical protein